MIAQIGSTNQSSQCRSSPTLPGVQLSGGTLRIPGKNGASDETIPMFSPDNKRGFSTVYKLYCDKLAGGDQLEVVLALASPQGRPSPNWISAEVDYDAFGRTRSAEPLRQCLVAKCGDIPAVAR
jgi:hypothetical protein